VEGAPGRDGTQTPDGVEVDETVSSGSQQLQFKDTCMDLWRISYYIRSSFVIIYWAVSREDIFWVEALPVHGFLSCNPWFTWLRFTWIQMKPWGNMDFHVAGQDWSPIGRDWELIISYTVMAWCILWVIVWVTFNFNLTVFYTSARGCLSFANLWGSDPMGRDGSL